MRYFKIVALAVSGVGKLIHRSGNTVGEDQFVPGMADELVEKKFMVECDAPVSKKKEEPYSGPSLEELQAEYLKLSGENKVNGNWGVPKLTKEVAALVAETLKVLSDTYDKAGGRDKTREGWTIDQYETVIAKLELLAVLSKTYEKAAGKDTVDDRDAWDEAKYESEITALKSD